ncbi:tetratricopeptide repeat protein [Acanthopleuribacter pedis]|uniref:Tetratricopeptide repeat protein n=1 Tax=Acanthopleuribacter pedis TaxID=442870 RepID=A0A8J7QM09_9BACT|nr:hypothetical protein [Acanthopleuribacter pedis]MBO1320813.1 hypothetical protein [Acanthopleuribacter pedis]
MTLLHLFVSILVCFQPGGDTLQNEPHFRQEITGDLGNIESWILHPNSDFTEAQRQTARDTLPLAKNAVAHNRLCFAADHITTLRKALAVPRTEAPAGDLTVTRTITRIDAVLSQSCLFSELEALDKRLKRVETLINGKDPTSARLLMSSISLERIPKDHPLHQQHQAFDKALADQAADSQTKAWFSKLGTWLEVLLILVLLPFVLQGLPWIPRIISWLLGKYWRNRLNIRIADLTVDTKNAAARSSELAQVFNHEIGKFNKQFSGQTNTEIVDIDFSSKLNFRIPKSSQPIQLPNELVASPITIGSVTLSNSLINFLMRTFVVQPAGDTLEGVIFKVENNYVFDLSLHLNPSLLTKKDPPRLSGRGPDLNRVIQEVAAKYIIHQSARKQTLWLTDNWKSLHDYLEGETLLWAPAGNDLEKARRCLERAVGHDPANWMARYRLALQLGTMGNHEGGNIQFRYLEMFFFEGRNTPMQSRLEAFISAEPFFPFQVRYNRLILMAQSRSRAVRNQSLVLAIGMYLYVRMAKLWLEGTTAKPGDGGCRCPLTTSCDASLQKALVEDLDQVVPGFNSEDLTFTCKKPLDEVIKPWLSAVRIQAATLFIDERPDQTQTLVRHSDSPDLQIGGLHYANPEEVGFNIDGALETLELFKQTQSHLQAVKSGDSKNAPKQGRDHARVNLEKVLLLSLSLVCHVKLHLLEAFRDDVQKATELDPAQAKVALKLANSIAAHECRIFTRKGINLESNCSYAQAHSIAQYSTARACYLIHEIRDQLKKAADGYDLHAYQFFNYALYTHPPGDRVHLFTDFAGLIMKVKTKHDLDWTLEAKRLLNEALKIDQKNQKSHFLMGTLYQQHPRGHNDDKATYHFEKSGNGPWSHFNLARIHYQNQDYEKALEELDHSFYQHEPKANWWDMRQMLYGQTVVKLIERGTVTDMADPRVQRMIAYLTQFTENHPDLFDLVSRAKTLTYKHAAQPLAVHQQAEALFDSLEALAQKTTDKAG